MEGTSPSSIPLTQSVRAEITKMGFLPKVSLIVDAMGLKKNETTEYKVMAKVE